MGRPRTRESCAGLLSIAVLVASGACTAPVPPATVDSGRVVVAEQYARGTIHRKLFGAGYRELWTKPIVVDSLDLADTAGGLEPVMEVGSMQTYALAFESGTGHSYTFRSLEKDPSRLLPWGLRVYPFTSVYRDQTAASLPAAPLVVQPLADALGVLSPAVHLVRLPDDPALGELRARFAGRVGTFQEYPTAGPDGAATFGASEILSTAELFERSVRTGVDRPDARAHLRGRLLDLWIGDWDRHPKQYRWARRTGSEPAWLPIPEDRDGAFARYDGCVIRRLRPATARLVSFEAEYPDGPGLYLQAHNLDAWALAGLDRRAFESMVSEVLEVLDDAEIARAVARLPNAWQEERGEWLAATLAARRAGLPAAAARLYERLAAEPRWVATTGADRLEGRCAPGGAVSLRLIGPAGETLLARRFLPGETDTVHVWLAGGADAVRIADPERCAVRVDVDRRTVPTEHPLDRGVPRWN